MSEHNDSNVIVVDNAGFFRKLFGKRYSVKIMDSHNDISFSTFYCSNHKSVIDAINACNDLCKELASGDVPVANYVDELDMYLETDDRVKEQLLFSEFSSNAM